MTRRNLLLTGAAFAAAFATSFIAPVAWAQASEQPIRLIVPYAAGGPIDVTARALAERVRDSLGTVIIDNKGGASQYKQMQDRREHLENSQEKTNAYYQSKNIQRKEAA